MILPKCLDLTAAGSQTTSVCSACDNRPCRHVYDVLPLCSQSYDRQDSIATWDLKAAFNPTFSSTQGCNKSCTLFAYATHCFVCVGTLH